MSRCNVRRALVAFGNWARKRGYLTPERRTVFDAMLNPKLPSTPIEILTPQELRYLTEGDENTTSRPPSFAEWRQLFAHRTTWGMIAGFFGTIYTLWLYTGWLPYYLDRLDEHWEKRAEIEMPLLKEKPSELVRKSNVYFSSEPGESQLAATIDYVGADHFVFASDIPHWDCEFPGNLEHLRNHPTLTDAVKEKMLYQNAKRLFNL